MKYTRALKAFLLILSVAMMGLFVLPDSWKEKIPFEGIKNNLLTKKPNFGLDLVGGRQIDYLVDLTEINKRNADNDPDNDRDAMSVVDSIGEILRNRIDPSGTRELNIYKAQYDEEMHIIVEITSDLDNEETLEKLQQVIDLKFKERGNTQPTEEEKTGLKTTAEKFLSDLTSDNFDSKAQFQNGNDNATYTAEKTYWKSSLEGSYTPEISEKIWNTTPGTVYPEVVLRETPTFIGNAEGGFEMITNTEYVVLHVVKKEIADREETKPGDAFDIVKKEVTERDDAVLPPAEETHEAAAEEVSSESVPGTVPEGINLEAEAVEVVDEPVVGEEAAPELIDPALTEPAGETTIESATPEVPEPDYPTVLEIMSQFPGSEALAELNPGDISEVYENDSEYAFFQIIAPKGDDIKMRATGIYVSKANPNAKEKIDAAKERTNSKTEVTQEDQLTVNEVAFGFDLSGWKDTSLGGMQFKRARVGNDPNTNRPIVEILFNEEGAKMFEEITASHVGDQIAIFVGGVLVSAPTVQEKISGGAAIITLGMPNYADAQKEAVRLARELNGGSTPAPFVEKGQYKIGATLGNEALQKSLEAGLIGFLLVALYMIVFYRYLGFIAVLALGFYSLFILFLLQAAIPFGWAALIGVVAFSVSMASFSSLESSDFLSLFIALILGIMVTFIAHTPIVLTLAGVSGIVLSVGMAVDANILIFERMKEEMRDGKSYSAASELGFSRAWPSIRDSNLSSLITCMILWIFGSAVIKGFAVALAMGIIISMLSAITVTRTLMSVMVGGKLAKMKKFFIGGGVE